MKDNQLNTSNGLFDTIYKPITNFTFNENLLNIDALHYNKNDAPYFNDSSNSFVILLTQSNNFLFLIDL